MIAKSNITDDVTNSNSPLLMERHVYKPFLYPWCFEAWHTQQRIHWLPEEVPLAEDVRDWKNKLTQGEKNLMTHIFRFFTQADVEVNNCYMKHYSQVFGPVEVQMMLAAFSNIETVHIAAYSHLLDTIGMPETEYSVFLTVKEMKDRSATRMSKGSSDRESRSRTDTPSTSETRGSAATDGWS